MLKTTGLPDKLAPIKNNRSRSIFNRNDNSRLAFGRNNSINKVGRFGVSRNDIEHTKKLGKLSKSEKLSKPKKLKSEKMSKFRNFG